MFTEAIRLFRQYMAAKQQTSMNDVAEHQIEVLQRLQNMDFILRRVRKLTERTAMSDHLAEVELQRMSAGIPQGAPDELREHLQMTEPLRITTLRFAC